MTLATDAAQSGFLNAVAQLNGTSNQSLMNQFQQQLDNLSHQAQLNNDAVMLRQIRQVSRAFNDPALQDTLRQSFYNIKSSTQSILDSQASNVTKTADIIKNLGKGAAVVDSVVTATKVVNSVVDGNYAQAGADLGTSLAASLLGGAFVAATVTTLGLTGAVALGAGVVTAGIAAAIVTTLMPYVIDTLSDALADFLTWWDPLGMMPDGINDDFNGSKNWTPPRRDPLAIDMDGDGIETIGADSTVVFDHNGDGVKTGTGWVSPDDGFLVFDRNGNGTIDTGAELFGVDTVKADGSLAVDGFDALSDLDSHGDGVFDASDTEFANVRLWQDADQEGISDASELSSLSDAGIVSIDLNADADNVILGNVQTATSNMRNTGTSKKLLNEGESLINRAIRDLESIKRDKKWVKSFFQEQNVLFAAA